MSAEDLLPFAKAKDMTLHWNLAEPVTATGNASAGKSGAQPSATPSGTLPPGASVGSPSEGVENGPGVRIPEEDLPFLFTPFCRVGRVLNKATGSRRGLYLVHAITMHGFSCQIPKHGTAGSRLTL